MSRVLSLAASLLTLAAIQTLDAQLPDLQFPSLVVVDSLLSSPGPSWKETRSRHFVLYSEQVRLPQSPAALLDSLEDAWTHATHLLDAAQIDESPATVLVVGSPSRFPGILVPSQRGTVRKSWIPLGREVIILVHNDSVRAFTRHEVMHVVSERVWGPPAAAWVGEGVATWADGRCESTSILAVARDLLQEEPELTASALPARVDKGRGPNLSARLRAYALAASFVAFVYDRAGSVGVRKLWRRDPGSGWFSGPADSLTTSWRAYVERGAADEKGLPKDSLERRGCG